MTNTKTWLHRHTLTADPQQQEQELARSRMQDKQRNNWWPLIVWRLVLTRLCLNSGTGVRVGGNISSVQVTTDDPEGEMTKMVVP